MNEVRLIDQLFVHSNIESLNSELIKQGVGKRTRMEYLHRVAKDQLKVLDTKNIEQKFRRLSDNNIKGIESK